VAYIKSRSEIVEHFRGQKQALQTSCESFDGGNKWEAARLATTVYSLVHDGGRNSQSILTQLGLRASLRLPSTGVVHPGNLLRDTPLVMHRIKGDGSADCLPLLDQGAPREEHLVQFPTWWDKETIFRDGDQYQLTRKGLVFSLRNQDGGSHVGAKLTDAAYVRLSKENISTPSAVFSGRPPKPLLGDEQASMRQVAWELLKSLDAMGDIA
jgi:hypothetical protein